MVPCNGSELARWYWTNHPGPKTPAWGKDGAACKRWLEYNTAEEFIEIFEKGKSLGMQEALRGPAWMIANAHLIKARGEELKQQTPEEVSANLALVSEVREGLAKMFKSGIKPVWIEDAENKKRLWGIK